MKNPTGTKQELIKEISALKRRIQELEQPESERKKMEEALRESEERFRRVTESLEEAVWYADLSGKFAFLSPIMADIYGRPLSEMMGNPDFWIEASHPEDQAAVHASKEVLLRDHRVELEYRIILPDGTVRWISDRKRLFRNEHGEPFRIAGILLDITDRKSMERALAEEHQRLSSILDGSPVSSFVIDHDHRVTAWNMVNENITGISKEDILGKPLDLSPLFKGRVPPALADLVLEMSDEEIMKRYGDKGIRKSEIHPQSIESIGSIWIKGKEHIMAVQATRFRDTAGNVIGAIQCAQDITEQQRSEQTLRESEGKLNAMLQSIPDHMSVMDKELNIVWANETALRVFGTAIIGRKCYEAYHRRKEPCEPYPCLALKAFKDGEVHEHDTEVVDKGGKTSYFHCTANVALRDKEDKSIAVLEISRDITEQKNAKDTLERQVKERTAEIAKKNKQLSGEIKKHKTTEAGLIRKEKELQLNSTKLHQLNAALKVLLKQREDDRRDLEEKVLSNVKHLINPNLETLKKRKLDPDSKIYVDILEQNLKNIISPFSHTLSSKYQNLTPTEIKVADMIRNGKATKEMAEFMGVSESAIKHHRHHIRNKCGILTQKINLRSHLLSLS